MDTIVVPDPTLILILIGAVTPLITGLLTKASASGTVKSLVAVALTLVGAVITWVIEHDGGFTVKEFVVWFAIVFVTHVATYYGAWKPIGGGTGSFTMNATPNFGVGPATPKGV